jgi:hypothetical protein
VTAIWIRPFLSGNRSDALSAHNNLEAVSIKYPFRLPYCLTGKPFPYHFIVSFHPGYRLVIRKYLAAFDVYQFEHANFADLLDGIAPEKPVVYNAHNVEYDHVTSECFAKWAKAITAKRIYSLERKVIQRCARVLACSENDKKRFMQLYAARGEEIEVISNGIKEIAVGNGAWGAPDPGMFPGLSKFRQRGLFAGSDSAHNRIAVKYILTDLAPRLRQECAFVIKGACGRRFQRHWSSNVFIDPEGSNIESYANVCTVALNPITQGGGTNLKILDYLCHGLPIVSTEFGMRGYDDLRNFVSICELNDFPGELRKEQRFRSEAIKVLERYLWRNSALKIKSIYSSLAPKQRLAAL